MTDDENARAHVIFHGRVQGVFFRANTRDKAEMYGLTGWVRNLRDGTVEAVFEGKKSIIERLLSEIKKGKGMGYARVDSMNVMWKKYKGEFDSFKIKYYW